MDKLGYAGRVGAVVLMAAVIFTGMVWYFKHDVLSQRYRLHVKFEDASGILRGVDVTMAGVKIGTVAQVTITPSLKADLELEIDRKYRIPVGSQFLVSVPVLGSVGTLSVVPPDGATDRSPAIPPGATGLTGGRVNDFQASMDDANQLMVRFKVTVSKLNRLLDEGTTLVGDPALKRGLRQSIVNLEQATRNGTQLTRDLNVVLQEDNTQVASLLYTTRSGTKKVLDNAAEATADIRDIASENRAALSEVVNNLRDTTAALQGISSQADSMLKDGGVAKNLSASVANLKNTTDKLDAIAGDLEKLSGDKALQSDIKTTVHNLAATTIQTNLLVQRVNRLVGAKSTGARTGATKGPQSSAAHPSAAQAGANTDPMHTILPRADLRFDTRDNVFRADIDGLVPLGKSANFVEAGIFGLGDANRLDLEYGTLADAGSNFDYRIGLHASKLGLGADYGLWRDFSISGDLYDPNYGQLDISGTLMFNQTAGLLVGGDNLTHHPGAVVGLELRR
ncbi:MAG: MlaD family protein [Capsulimonadaceae bacterium]